MGYNLWLPGRGNNAKRQELHRSPHRGASDTCTYNDAKRVLDVTLFFLVKQNKIARLVIPGQNKDFYLGLASNKI